MRVFWVVVVNLGLLDVLITIIRKDWHKSKKVLANLNPAMSNRTHLVVTVIGWFLIIILFAAIGIAFTTALLA